MVMAVLILAIVGPFICHFYIGSLRPAFLTLYMLGPIGVAFYVPFRRAWPVIAFGAGAILFVSSRIDEPNAMMRGFVVATITVTTACMLAVIRDHLVQTVQSNREISERDSLTGAFNMHKFDERLSEEMEISDQGGDGFDLLVFDLDYFKPVNDEYSHKTGDDVLIATAEAIQSVLGPHDLLIRRGGDEFFVIAPLLPDRDSRAVMVAARDRIARARRALCPDLVPTACAGAAHYQRNENAVDLIKRADAELHDAKHASKLVGSAPIIKPSRSDIGFSPLDAPPASYEVIELRRRRADVAAIGENPMEGTMRIVWNTAAVATIALASVIFVLCVAGETTFILSPVIISQFVLWAFVFAPFAVWVTRNHETLVLDHALCLFSLILITTTCLAVGEAAPAAVEIYMMAALLYLTVMPTRIAIFYCALAFVLYAGFLFAHDVPNADMRIATTLVNFGFVGLILALTRKNAIEAAEEKAALANTDALTGLPNLRSLRSRLATEVERSETTKTEIAVLMLDLDDFKAVNDIHSHSIGDEMLIAVGKALAQTARVTDLPARRGGDEFMVLMVDADQAAAEIAAKRVAMAVQDARAEILTDITPTVSIGLVVRHDKETAEELLARADDALHEAKIDSTHELVVGGELLSPNFGR
jgi:diguanylate cyclase (GGDEF)-like protein